MHSASIHILHYHANLLSGQCIRILMYILMQGIGQQTVSFKVVDDPETLTK